MPTTMSRIRNRFRDLATGGMELVTESITAEENLHLPVYDDMSNADPTISSVAISIGNHPHGVWWHNGDQWFAGDRTKAAADNEDVGSQDTTQLLRFEMPLDLEIDVWQAQVDVLSDEGQDVAMEIYDETADEIVFSHSFADHGNTVVFGDPLTVEPLPEGHTAVFRIANNDSGTETVGGWIVWSFQEQIN